MTAKEYYKMTHPIDVGITTKEECISMMEEYAQLAREDERKQAQEQRQGLSEEKEQDFFDKAFELISELPIKCEFNEVNMSDDYYLDDSDVEKVAEELSLLLSAPTSEEREKWEMREKELKNICATFEYEVDDQKRKIKQLEAELANCKRDLKASESVGSQLAEHVDCLNKELAELNSAPKLREVSDKEITKQAELNEEGWDAEIGFEHGAKWMRDLLKGGEGK